MYIVYIRIHNIHTHTDSIVSTKIRCCILSVFRLCHMKLKKSDLNTQIFIIGVSFDDLNQRVPNFFR